jgi:hypothetical protein
MSAGALTPERTMIRDLAREFAMNEVLPSPTGWTRRRATFRAS